MFVRRAKGEMADHLELMMRDFWPLLISFDDKKEEEENNDDERKMIFSAKAAQHEHDLGGSQKGILMGLRGCFWEVIKER